MKLHSNKKLFRQAIQFTSDQMQILPIYIEKDYWVTFALFTIFKDKIGNDTVFKGGTALSKCYKIIERFSEDIDLVVLRREGETNNQLTNKIKSISKVVAEVLPTVEIAGLTHKMGMNRKTAHSYNKEFKGSYGQVRDVIVIEATWLGDSEPYTKMNVCSLAGQMMIDNGQADIANENHLLPFELNALEPTRTICEKIMSLVRFSYGENPIADLKNKIRHVYDLHQLLLEKEFMEFFNSKEFDEMLLKVGNNDLITFKNNNKWLSHHPSNAIIFKESKEVWKNMRSTYEIDFKNLVYGDLPNESDLLRTIEKIKDRLSSIVWTIKIQ